MMIDISRPIGERTVVYPGDPPVRMEQLASIEKDGYKLTKLSMCLHTATHMDAPSHFLPSGQGIADLPLERFTPRATVVDCGDSHCVEAEHVLHSGVQAGEAILFRTRNSSMSEDALVRSWVYISPEAARACVEQRVSLVGFDHLEIERDMDQHAHPVHKVLLSGGILILENIDLRDVATGVYRLYCLPLLIQGAEASPCRAVLEHLPLSS